MESSERIAWNEILVMFILFIGLFKQKTLKLILGFINENYEHRRMKVGFVSVLQNPVTSPFVRLLRIPGIGSLLACRTFELQIFCCRRNDSLEWLLTLDVFLAKN